MQAEPIGEQGQLASQLSAIFVGLRWDKSSEAWNGTIPNCRVGYIDIWLHPGDDGLVRFIVMNKAAPSAMRKVCEKFNLNYVAAPEADDLVDIYAYDDDDRYYAKKNWQI